jgi:hypothetical protein
VTAKAKPRKTAGTGTPRPWPQVARESLRPARRAMQPGELDAILVSDEAGLCAMEGYLLSADRDRPVIALLQREEGGVILPGEAREIVGAGPRIYLIEHEALLGSQSLPGMLALPGGCCARIWQPGLSSSSSFADHPLVSAGSCELARSELARQFDLSRPIVRRRIKQLEETHEHNMKFLNDQLDQLTLMLSAPS